MPSTIVLNEPLPPSAIRLGRLVREPLYPENEFLQPTINDIDLGNEEREGEGEIRTGAVATVEYRLDNLVETLERSRGTSLEVTLLNILRLIWNVNDSEIRATLVACHGTVCQLRNPDAFFKAACRDAGVREWIEEQARRPQWREQSSLFLVCGLKVLTDARIEQVGRQRSSIETNVTLPVAAAAMLPLPPPLGLDVGLGITVRSGEGGQAAYTIRGEYVYAVQYRKIRFSRFSTRSADNAYLEKKNHWKSYLVDRADEEEEDEEEDGISAQIADPPQTDDLDGGVFECFDMDGEQIIYEVENDTDED